MLRSRLFGACWAALAMLALAMSTPARAQTNFDRPGGDYQRSVSMSGDPAECALICERDKKCRAWSFNYPSDNSENAVCWLKDKVPPRIQSYCCVSGVRGAGVIEPRSGPMEISTDRWGGDYRSFEVKNEDKAERGDTCRDACKDDNKCRAWSFARPGYVGKNARCFLKNDIKPPRRRPGYISGVVR